MNAQERIARLESLLERVKRKAASPRPQRFASPATARERAASPNAPAVAPSPAPAPTMAPARSPEPAPVRAHVPSPEPAPVRVQAPSPEPGPVRAAAPPLPSPEPIAVAPPMSTPPDSEPPPEIEELDMMDADIVELGEEAAGASASAAAGAFEDEPAPESAPRTAAPVLDALDLEPPVKTPPPESGRQAVTASAAEAPAVEMDAVASSDSLEADLSGVPISKGSPNVPTMEQLGETVELEGADVPDAALELAVPAAAAAAVSAAPEPDDLELSLPGGQSPGAYDGELAPPPEARQELAEHRRSEERRAETEIMPPRSMALSSAVDVSAETVRATGPVVVERPPSDGAHVAEFILAKPGKTPETFAEMLDASLRL